MMNETQFKTVFTANTIMEPKVKAVKNVLCMACLCVERTLRELCEGKYKQYYIDSVNEIPLYVMPRVLSVCWECEAMLKKAVDFKEQVKDSYRILQTYTSENLVECLLTDVTRPPRLKVYVNNPINILPSLDITEESHKNDRNSDCIKIEPKCENLDGEIRRRDESISRQCETDGLYEETCGGIKVPSKNPARKDQNASKGLAVVDVKGDVEIEFENKNLPDVDSDRGSILSDCLDLNLDTEVQSTAKKTKKKSKREKTVKQGRKFVKKVPSKNPARKDQNALEKNTEELAVVDLKEHEIDFENNDENTDRDSLVSDCLDLNLDTKVQSITRKTKKKSKGEKTVKQGKKIIKKVRKPDDVSIPITPNNISAIKLTYEEMMSERLKESTKESYQNAPHKCKSCIIGFNSGKAYKTHVTTKHSTEIGEHKCPICNITVSSLESFTEHCKRHFRRYECAICLKRTMDKKTMEQHFISTHEISPNEYRCNVCGKISNSLKSHRYHKETHKSRVQCPECEKTFSHRAGLMNHRLAFHERQNTFPCTECDKVFRWRTSLRRHLEKHDLKSKGVNTRREAFCATCSIEFSSLCSYRRHLRNSLKHVTRDQHKFICNDCDKRFADKTKLRDHIEEKHLHKIYYCPICDKARKNRVGLDQHIRNVHKSRPNSKMCHYCGKGFPTKVQLESHIRTHTGERPFICEYCPTTFSQKSNLYKHNRQVHLNIKSKRLPICKKRKEDKKPMDIIPHTNQDLKQPDVRSNFPEQFTAKLKTPEFIVGWH